MSLFADDSLIYRVVENNSDRESLQQDLNKLGEWSDKWLLRFNVAKCVHLRIHPSRSAYLPNSYSLLGTGIAVSDKTKYLGITIADSLNFAEHINNISNKANKSLGLVRRNFSKCTPSVREQLYKTLIRPQMEYASSAWDPHQQHLSHALEKIQNRGARFIANDWRQNSSVTAIKERFNIPSLARRRKDRRLCTFYNYREGLLAIDNFPALPPPRVQSTRFAHHHNHMISQVCAPRTDYLRQSYLFNTISDWNKLPPGVVDATDYASFSRELARLP